MFIIGTIKNCYFDCRFWLMASPFKSWMSSGWGRELDLWDRFFLFSLLSGEINLIYKLILSY